MDYNTAVSNHLDLLKALVLFACSSYAKHPKSNHPLLAPQYFAFSLLIEKARLPSDPSNSTADLHKYVDMFEILSTKEVAEEADDQRVYKIIE